MDEDLVLLERWRAGAREAGEQLFRRHFHDIYRFFEHKLGAEADELAQQTFMACVAARDQFRAQASFRTYLFTIARHEFYAHLKRRNPHRQLDFSVTSLAEVVTTPASRMARGEEAQRLRAALATLPADQQLLLELHYWHELDAAALANVFEIAPGAIRVRLLRARRALRNKLASMEGPLAQGGDPLGSSLLDDALDRIDED
jgi:RNA polymerase sigma factor (sigma-70 family)